MEDIKSTTLKLFLVYGDPQRLRTAEISNWSGMAVAAPRTELDELLGRGESRSQGVYILTGIDSSTGNLRAYIGEGEVIADRIRHHKRLDFWIQVFIFVSKDENLTKGHIRYLEGRLIEIATATGRAILENLQGSGAALPESDKADMEVFLSKIQILLPVLGSNLLTPRISSPKDSSTVDDFLICKIKGLTAKGRRSTNGFVVFEGSQAVLELRDSTKDFPHIVAQRDKLIADGTLVIEDDRYRFSKDVEISSPSMAGAIVRGGSTNGLTAWKNETGIPLRELEGS